MPAERLPVEIFWLNPNSEVVEHARPGLGWTRPRVQHWVRDFVSRRVCTIPSAGVFREDAEDCARGGRAPFSISEFGLNRFFAA
jgi:hypothetical protein